jgi:flagellar biogenesis protein FliO
MRLFLALLFMTLLTAEGLTQVRPPATAPVASQPSATPPSLTAGTPESQRPAYSGMQNTPATPAPKKSSLVSQIVNTLLNLTLVIGAAYLVMLGVKRYMNGSLRVPGLSGAPPARALRVVETLSLAQGRTLYLVAAGERVLLIGASGQQVSLVSDVTGDPAITAAIAAGESAVATGPFATLLARALPATQPKEQP